VGLFMALSCCVAGQIALFQLSRQERYRYAYGVLACAGSSRLWISAVIS
jgi:hypothetical protein